MTKIEMLIHLFINGGYLILPPEVENKATKNLMEIKNKILSKLKTL